MPKQAEALTYPNLREAAKAAGLSRATFSKNVLPLIPHQKVGNRVLISRIALQRWLEGHDAEANQ